MWQIAQETPGYVVKNDEKVKNTVDIWSFLC